MLKYKEETQGPSLSPFAEARKGTQSYCKVTAVFCYCAVRIRTNCTTWLTCAVLKHKAKSAIDAANFNIGVVGSNPTPGITKCPASSVWMYVQGNDTGLTKSALVKQKYEVLHSEAKR
jgi:hypothetical protein